MAWTNEQTYVYRDTAPKLATDKRDDLAFISFKVAAASTSARVANFAPEPSSANIISPADAVRRYWRWDSMPETMRRLA
jgi:hypothetical protein